MCSEGHVIPQCLLYEHTNYDCYCGNDVIHPDHNQICIGDS